jgi:hypothetical protein
LLHLNLTRKEKDIINTFNFQSNLVRSMLDVVSYIRMKIEIEQIKNWLIGESGNNYMDKLKLPKLEEMKKLDENFLCRSKIVK